jgi:Outer membrane cytochrome MtrC/MtrF-like, domains II/IV/Cytochrome c554 and c-prime
MKLTKFLFLLVVLIAASAMIFGCAEDGVDGADGADGNDGNDGPAGPGGPAGTGGPETYLGGEGEFCIHCHSQTTMAWEETGHAEAYESIAGSETNLYCVQCHTTGFDATVAYGDTVVAEGNEGPDIYGFDDYLGLDTPEATARMEALHGVQCESCHGAMGPVDDLGQNHGEISFSSHIDSSSGVAQHTASCGKCHHSQLDEEWLESGHAQAGGSYDDFQSEYYANSSSCQPCHTSEGFIRENDPAFANYDFGEFVSQIGCVTCHDPHSNANEHQLREVGSEQVVYHPGLADESEDIPSMSGFGNAQICAQCHHARRTATDVAEQIAEGSSHMGPHGSPQMDMFIGNGSYEIDGFTYSRASTHQSSVTDACVECHMQRDALVHGEVEEHSFHTFAPTTDNCLPCHTLTEGDFTFEGTLGGQPATIALMNALATAIDATYTDHEVWEENWDSTDDDVTVAQREAAYTLYFVINDGSHGVHNINYAQSLLQNAIDHLAAQ